jgi:hypothetical protein
MSFPRFFVTYCVMDMDAGANPFGHSCLIFSKQEIDNGPIEAIDAIGFYSQPSTTTNPIIKTLKSLLGFPIDLQDGHGVLIQESIRYLNGNGLKGMSFAITEQQFTLLKKNYRQLMEDEQTAINELNKELASHANGYTRHVAEKEKAKIEKRPPRLKPFHVVMELTRHGFDSSNSYTCKDRVLDILQENGVITDSLRKKIESSKAKQTFPRCSSLHLPAIRLISTGEPQKVISSKGAIFYNHVWDKNGLFWATHPENEFETEEYQPLKSILNRITAMENTLHKTIDQLKETEENKEYRRQLHSQLKRVQNLAYLFNNAHENKTELINKLIIADKVLYIADLIMEPERLNPSFLLRAYTSSAAQNALVGFLAIMLSVALTLVALPIGIALTAASTITTARQLYGFYQEEKELSKVSVQDLTSSSESLMFT